MSGVEVEVTDSERIDVGDGVSLPKAWNAVAVGEPNVAGAIHLHVVFDEQLRRTAAASVRLDRVGRATRSPRPRSETCASSTSSRFHRCAWSP